MNIYL